MNTPHTSVANPHLTSGNVRARKLLNTKHLLFFQQKENDTIDHSEDTSNKADETLETVKKALEEEKRQKLQLVMLLLHDRRQIAMRLLEERRRTDELSRRLRNESLRTKTLASELEEESQRSLALEAEVEACGRRIDETKKVRDM